MRRTPRLDDFACFQKVIDRGSFAAAARDLGIPKSTLSKSIARLEGDLGIRLLERTTRKSRATEIGRIVATHSRDMVDAFQAARIAAAAAIDEPSGRIRVSCPPGLLENLVDDIVLTFLESFPKVAIELQVTARPVDLIDDNVDLALRARTQMEAGASFVVRRLGRTRGILVASPTLLQDAAAIRAPGDLRLLPAITLPGDSGDWRLMDDNGFSHSVSVSSRLVTSDIETVLKAAVRGLGVAQLPEHLCVGSISEGRLVRVLPDVSTIIGTIYAVFSRETAKSTALRAFVDHLARAFKELSMTP